MLAIFSKQKSQYSGFLKTSQVLGGGGKVGNLEINQQFTPHPPQKMAIIYPELELRNLGVSSSENGGYPFIAGGLFVHGKTIYG